MPSEDPEDRPARSRAPRSDSLRNREALIEAARVAFAAEGLNASLDAIATSAGVGAGTLYRHFPSRSDLWGVVLVEPLNEQLRLVEEALRDEDKWAGLSGYIMASCALEADSRGYLNLMTTRLDGSDTLVALRRRIQALIEELVRQAREAGRGSFRFQGRRSRLHHARQQSHRGGHQRCGPRRVAAQCRALPRRHPARQGDTPHRTADEAQPSRTHDDAPATPGSAPLRQERRRRATTPKTLLR